MTELNHVPEPEMPEPEIPEAEEPEAEHTPAGVSWPALPADIPAEQPGTVQDPAITAVLERLATLPGTPVSGHGEIYSRLHDELMEALNEDVTGQINATRDSLS